jgi:hypothetical protein
MLHNLNFGVNIMATANTKPQTATPAAAPVKPATSTSATKTVGGLKLKKVKAVTLPVLKLQPGAPAIVRFESAMRVSDQIETAKGGDRAKAMEPATVAHVVDMQTGEEAIIIVGKVLKGELDKAYPSNSYVGKTFEIINKGKLGDKKYNAYSVTEVEIED